MSGFVMTIALVGIVIVVASLLSGALERKGVPLVAFFLALGVALGPWGLGVANVGLDSPVLRGIATLALTLVLFSDAVTFDLRQVRSHLRLAWRLLGPGTLLPALLIALASAWLLGLSAPAAAILGAALASTDPVLLRSVLRSPGFPPPARMALRLETGMNDVVLLPVVVLAMLFLGGGPVGAGEMVRHALGLFLLGPALGGLVGWIGIVALGQVRDRVGVRRDYESLYAIGLAFTGYAAAEAVGGSGFLAAFAAGAMVAWQDVELCDCFLEYGEATAEMLLLLTFVALGMSLIWSGLEVASWRTLAFAAIALSVRTLVLLPVLRGVGLGTRDRRLVAAFGPRGLSSLLFALLPVFEGIAGAERIFTITCLVVLLSVVVHGGGIALFLRRGHRRAAGARPEATGAAAEPAAARAAPGAPLPAAPEASAPPAAAAPPERIEIAELRELVARGEPVTIADARAERSYDQDEIQAKGAIRLPPQAPVRAASELRLAHHGTIVVYCA
jgi:NhaP-type Na+/H+ or K+/H+ antiporter